MPIVIIDNDVINNPLVHLLSCSLSGNKSIISLSVVWSHYTDC